jgi:quercetin dioxygenase-like cupin family protein
MHKLTRLTLLALASTAASARADAPAGLPPVDSGQAVIFSDVKWTPFRVPEGAPIPAGLMVSRVAGDAQTGPSVSYVKFPAGYAFPAHWHSFTEYSVVISGILQSSVNGKATALPPGSYFVLPAKTVHQTTCQPGQECVVLVRRAGPTDYHFEK